MIKRIIPMILATTVIASLVVAFPHERAAATLGGTTVVTAAGAGIFPTGASFSGIKHSPCRIAAGREFGLHPEQLRLILRIIGNLLKRRVHSFALGLSH